MAEELNAEGIISQLDARALELLVEAYTEYRHHCETLDVEGYTYRTETQSGDVLIKGAPAAAMKADARSGSGQCLQSLVCHRQAGLK